MQRLTIARATLHEPDVLLLDEPYTGLDQDASALLDNLLQHESQNGRTILMITHDLVHGLNLCEVRLCRRSAAVRCLAMSFSIFRRRIQAVNLCWTGAHHE